MKVYENSGYDAKSLCASMARGRSEPMIRSGSFSEKMPQRPITAAICTKTRSHRRWPRFSIPISEAAKTFTASAAAQKTEKRDVFQSAIPSARRAGSLGLCEGALRERKRA